MDSKSEKVTAILKGRRQQKEQKKVPGSEGPFNPTHYKATHGEDPESPNQYAHKVSEALSTKGTANSLGTKHAPKVNVFKSRLLPSQRTSWQHSGNQKMANAKGKPTRYTAEEVVGKVLKKVKKMKEENTKTTEKDLGRPDTGGSTDTVTVNPKLPELKGQLK